MVSDEGSGISDDDLKKIFKPNVYSTAADSNGLGLNICKRIAQSLGGDL